MAGGFHNESYTYYTMSLLFKEVVESVLEHWTIIQKYKRRLLTRLILGLWMKDLISQVVQSSWNILLQERSEIGEIS